MTDVMAHAQEYMFFDLIIQVVNALLLMLIVTYLMRIKRKIVDEKK